MEETIWRDHLEVSEGTTKIVSRCLCPLNKHPEQIDADQIFNNTVCCQVEGQDKDFTCSHFYGAIYDTEFFVDCRYNPTVRKDG